MSYGTDRLDKEIVRLLQKGGVGLLPSDTIYGLSCRALDKQAVERIHHIKRRDKNKPFVILISGMDQLKDLGITTTDAALALSYWPGKLTIICDAEKSPGWLHMGFRTLAVRQPDYPGLRELIKITGPLISTSANMQDGRPAESVFQAKKYFGDKLDFYVDAGRLSGRPSTIVRPVFDKLDVIRQGAVRIKKKDRL